MPNFQVPDLRVFGSYEHAASATFSAEDLGANQPRIQHIIELQDRVSALAEKVAALSAESARHAIRVWEPNTPIAMFHEFDENAENLPGHSAFGVDIPLNLDVPYTQYRYIWLHWTAWENGRDDNRWYPLSLEHVGNSFEESYALVTYHHTETDEYTVHIWKDETDENRLWMRVVSHRNLDQFVLNVILFFGVPSND